MDYYLRTIPKYRHITASNPSLRHVTSVRRSGMDLKKTELNIRTISSVGGIPPEHIYHPPRLGPEQHGRPQRIYY